MYYFEQQLLSNYTSSLSETMKSEEYYLEILLLKGYNQTGENCPNYGLPCASEPQADIPTTHAPLRSCAITWEGVSESVPS